MYVYILFFLTLLTELVADDCFFLSLLIHRYEGKLKRKVEDSATETEVNFDGSGTSLSKTATSAEPGMHTTHAVLARYGARALEVGGPLADLRTLIYQYMQPWRPLQCIHIGTS